MAAKNEMLIVLSAPSATGKTTVVQALQEKNKSIRRVVTHTTRERREGERNGRDYHFVSKEIFKKEMNKNKFVEWAEVYGNYYGTSKKEILRIQKAKKTPILVIEEVGARQVQAQYKEAVFILLLPPSMRELQKRIEKRKKDSSTQIKKRIASAKKEIKAMQWYDYVVVNKDVDAAVRAIEAIVSGESRRLRRNKNIFTKFLQ